MLIAFINFHYYFCFLGFRFQVSGDAATTKEDGIEILRRLINPDTCSPSPDKLTPDT